MNIKEIVGKYAAKYVEDGMVVGLGTGSTAYWFVEEIGRKIADGELKNIVAVSTSDQTSKQAESLGIPLYPLDDVMAIDVLVDGADESTIKLEGIKGGGGALLHEKIVAENSHKVIWIVDESKVVKALGKFPLPVEVVRLGSFRLLRKFEEAGFNPKFRKRDGDSLFITDSGNYIIDLYLETIQSPYQLAVQLKNTTGVVDHGLFLNHADILLIGREDGSVVVVEKNDQPELPGM